MRALSTMKRIVFVLFIALSTWTACLGEDSHVILENDTGVDWFLTEISNADNLKVKSPTKRITVSDAKMVYGDNGSTCTPNTGATANANQFVKAADVALRKGASLYKTWGKYGEGGQGQRQGGQDQGQGRTNGWDSRHYRQIINVLYLGGTSSANGASEGRKELTGEYILKGYLLEFVLAASNTGPVTWTFKKGTEEVGTFHNGSGWSDYGTTIAKGDDTVIYWRSDTGGQINDVYTVTATYMQDGQQVTTSRTLKSRSMAPDNPDLRDYFNEDVDMLQRVMIQICFLDKGRLDSWEIGKYRDNNTGSYYHSTVLVDFSHLLAS